MFIGSRTKKVKSTRAASRLLVPACRAWRYCLCLRRDSIHKDWQTPVANSAATSFPTSIRGLKGF